MFYATIRTDVVMKRFTVTAVFLLVLLVLGCSQTPISEPASTTKTYENSFIRVVIPHETFVDETSETEVTMMQGEDVVKFELSDIDFKNGRESEINGIPCLDATKVDDIGKNSVYHIPYSDQTINIYMLLGEISSKNKLIGMIRSTLELK